MTSTIGVTLMSDVTSGDFGGFIRLLLLAQLVDCHAGYLASAFSWRAPLARDEPGGARQISTRKNYS